MGIGHMPNIHWNPDQQKWLTIPLGGGLDPLADLPSQAWNGMDKSGKVVQPHRYSMILVVSLFPVSPTIYNSKVTSKSLLQLFEYLHDFCYVRKTHRVLAVVQ